jgi:ABC-type lipoprotein release transport system permease subunit
MVLVAIGAATGLGLAMAAARTARGLLYNLEPWDPATLLVAVAALCTVALVASWLPARRASRLEPTIALREGV